jgi:hypothetical protein
MRMHNLFVPILLGFVMGFSANANAKIACEAWCSKCNPGASCTADCVRRNQPLVPDSCERSANGRIPCNAWCDKCKPDAACRQACVGMNNRQVSNSCSVRQ